MNYEDEKKYIEITSQDYQQAFEELKKYFTELSYTMNGTDSHREAIYIAMRTVENKIPKKVKLVNKNGVPDGNWVKVCPTCGKVLIERVTTPEMSYPRQFIWGNTCSCGQSVILGGDVE